MAFHFITKLPQRLQQSVPAAFSTSTSNHAMRTFTTDKHMNATAFDPPPDHHTTPYLGLRARLSQTWINRWTILLLLVLVRTLLAIGSLDDNLASARRQALSACTSVENVGSAMASIPHYMADGVNDMTIRGVEKAVNGLMEMLILTVTGVEEIILFIINLLTSTYVCLITLAVSGSLHVAINVAEDVGNFLNSTAQEVGKDLGGAAKDFQSTLNGFLSDLNKVTSLFSGKSSDPPKIDLSSEIDKLNKLKLPTEYDQGLAKLNKSIPTFEQVQNFTDTAIRWPFEEVKKLLNQSLPKYTMNHSMFPIPAKKQLSFCSENDPINNFFDDLVKLVYTCKKIFLAVLILLAILAMVPMAYREYRSWRFMQTRSQTIMKETRDPMDAVYLATRPYTSSFGLWLSKRFRSVRHQNLVRWSVAYATTVPALFVLSLAVAGLLACLCQYILLKAVEKEVPALTAEVGAFADKVVLELNNASQSWAYGANHAINETNKKINQDIFGWVNITTHAVNNTLNVFVDEMVGALNHSFGGTVLYKPVMDVMNCLVFLKIRGIEKGLTWVSNHAHVDFPLLDSNTFSLGAASKMSGTQSDLLATGPGDGATDDIARIVNRVTAILAKAIEQETIISACLLIVWVIIVLIGIARASMMIGKGDDNYVVEAYISPTNPYGPNSEKDIQDISGVRAPAPTYEQALSTPPLPNDHGANRLHGQAYTLKPAPLPTFEHTRATSPILQTRFDPRDEKLGNVGSQQVDSAVRRPTHVRESSHGDYALTSPLSPRLPNPYRSHPHDKLNPFHDSHR